MADDTTIDWAMELLQARCAESRLRWVAGSARLYLNVLADVRTDVARRAVQCLIEADEPPTSTALRRICESMGGGRGRDADRYAAPTGGGWMKASEGGRELANAAFRAKLAEMGAEVRDLPTAMTNAMGMDPFE